MGDRRFITATQAPLIEAKALKSAPPSNLVKEGDAQL